MEVISWFYPPNLLFTGILHVISRPLIYLCTKISHPLINSHADKLPQKEDVTTPEVSTASSSPSVVYEKDILEEDVDDSEYIPYQRKNKAKKAVEQATKGDYN